MLSLAGSVNNGELKSSSTSLFVIHDASFHFNNAIFKSTSVCSTDRDREKEEKCLGLVGSRERWSRPWGWRQKEAPRVAAAAVKVMISPADQTFTTELTTVARCSRSASMASAAFMKFIANFVTSIGTRVST
ncbi:hypothetical protein FF1_009388 [Malus domestica]